MPTKEQATPEAPAAEKADWARQRGTVIAREILRVLGLPAGLRGVDVRPLWDNHYRANVLVGGDATSVTIAHSYFLQADGEGVILASTPALTRVYGAEGGNPG
jgi:hypothetical protein